MTTAKTTGKRTHKPKVSESFMADARKIRLAQLKEAADRQHAAADLVEEKARQISEFKLEAPVPTPPSATVLALQSHVLDLVNERTAIQMRLHEANTRLRMAQVEAESARERMSQVEGEVQYRLNLIAQMEGRAPQSHYSAPTPFSMPPMSPAEEKYAYRLANEAATTLFNAAAPQDIGSIPAAGFRPSDATVYGEARTESAEDLRRSL